MFVTFRVVSSGTFSFRVMNRIVSRFWISLITAKFLAESGPSNCTFMFLLLEFLSLRLVSSNNCAGRLEVFYNGTWGSICSNRMSQLTAITVCKHLNCGDGGEIAEDFKYGRGLGPMWLDHIECTDQHTSLWQCQSDPWNPQSCDNRAEETHISCTGN